MEEQDAPYSAVLGEAKALGYAEADESLDVLGWDTAHKAVVLAYLAHGTWVKPEQMIVEGIDRITPGELAQVAAAMASQGVSIASVIQSAQEPAGAAALVLTTHQSNERAMGATLARLARLKCVLEKPLLLRIGDFSE